MRNSYTVFINLKTDHTPDLNNLLWVANSVIDLFWPPDPSNPSPANNHLQDLVEKHSIKKDVGALFYTFPILLLVASEEAIRERKEEVRDATSSMLRILEEDTELVVNVTRTIYQQFHWALNVLHYYISKEAVAEGLVPKLQKLHTALTQEKSKVQ